MKKRCKSEISSRRLAALAVSGNIEKMMHFVSIDSKNSRQRFDVDDTLVLLDVEEYHIEERFVDAEKLRNRLHSDVRVRPTEKLSCENRDDVDRHSVEGVVRHNINKVGISGYDFFSK